MIDEWKTIRIFISSTFVDMHNERDYLVRTVFPELKEICRKKKIHLTDIDLRWGVTKEQAVGGKARDICLDVIDDCRPYFVGLIGHRYGEVHEGYNHSVSAEEIYHGVLHDFLPRQVKDLKKIIKEGHESNVLSPGQINCIKECYYEDGIKEKYILTENVSTEEKKIIRSAFSQLDSYKSCNTILFFRAESLSRKYAEEYGWKYGEPGEDRNKLDALKKEIIDAGVTHYQYDDLETLGTKLVEFLSKRIEIDFGSSVKEGRNEFEKERQEQEEFIADRSRLFEGRENILAEMRRFCKNKDTPPVMVIRGESGCGKSALMAQFYKEAQAYLPGWQVWVHFVGATSSSTDPRQTARHLTHFLNKITGEQIDSSGGILPAGLFEKASIKANILIVLDGYNQYEKIDQAHPLYWLPRPLPENIKIIISTLSDDLMQVLSAKRIKPVEINLEGLTTSEINKMVARYLETLRRRFPSKDVKQRFFEKIKNGNPLYIMTALEELRVFGVFEKFGNEVDQLPDSVPDLFDKVLNRIESDFSNPDMVKACMSFIACGKLGMSDEELQVLLGKYSPSDKRQVEKEVEPKVDEFKLPPMLWQRLRRAFGVYLYDHRGVINFFHNQLLDAVKNKYLSIETKRRTHKAIAELYENTWKDGGRQLEVNRAIDDLPRQFIRANDWEGVYRVLTDYEFIETKCRSGMLYELISDYKMAVDALTAGNNVEAAAGGVTPERLKKYMEDFQTYHTFFKKQAHILRPNIDLLLQQMVNHPDINLITKKVRKEIEETGTPKQPYLHLLNKPKKPDKQPLQLVLSCSEPVFSLCISRDNRLIAAGAQNGKVMVWERESGREWKSFEFIFDLGKVWKISFSKNDTCIQAETTNSSRKIWDLETGEVIAECRYCYTIPAEGMPEWENQPAEDDPKKQFEILVEHRDLVLKHLETGKRKVLSRLPDTSSNIFARSAVLTHDERYAVAGTVASSEILLIELSSGEIVSRVKAHTHRLERLAISGDDRYIISASPDKTVKVWDFDALLKAGERGKDKKIGHSRNIYGLTITSDGSKAFTGSVDHTRITWDLQTGEALSLFTGEKSDFGPFAISPDSRSLVITDKYGRVFDLETNQITAVSKIHKEFISCIALTPDGKYAVSGSENGSLIYWELMTGEEIFSLKDSYNSVYSLAITSDGQFALTAEQHHGINVYSLKEGEKAANFAKKSDKISSIALTPDDRFVVSGNDKGKLEIWDIRSRLSGNSLPEDREILGAGTHLSSGGISPDSINTVAVAPDGRYVAAGHKNQYLKIFDFVTGRLVTEYYAGDEIRVCGVGNDNRIICGDKSGSVYIFSLERVNTLEDWLKSADKKSEKNQSSLLQQMEKERCDLEYARNWWEKCIGQTEARTRTLMKMEPELVEKYFPRFIVEHDPENREIQLMKRVLDGIGKLPADQV